MLQCSKLIACDLQVIKMTLKGGIVVTLTVAQMINHCVLVDSYIYS
jgi:hypothetical protein